MERFLFFHLEKDLRKDDFSLSVKNPKNNLNRIKYVLDYSIYILSTLQNSNIA